MIKIVTDSCIDFPVNVRKKIIGASNIVPLSFEIGGTYYQDGDVTTGQF